jgi:invasion protein IalB
LTQTGSGRARRAVAATLPLASFLGLALLGAVPARAQEQMPRYLRELDRAVNAGDWTLQCNSSGFCQVVGVVTVPRNHIGVRTVVMIARDGATGAQPVLRLAFLDSTGALAVPPPDDNWRLIPRGRLRGEVALRFA